MKLFLYSSFYVNNPLDVELRHAVENLQSKSLTIFMSNSDNFQAKYVYIIADYFANCGFKDISVCLYSKSPEETEAVAREYVDIKFIGLADAFNSDAIFLSGGSTYYFVNSLRKHGLLQKLIDYAKGDHLLLGMSAGSMLMTPDISNSIIPTYDPEPNPIGKMDETALGLVDFYFFPHYDGDERFIAEVQEFANETQKDCYVCADQFGVMVENENIVPMGDVLVVNPQ